MLDALSIAMREFKCNEMSKALSFWNPRCVCVRRYMYIH